MNIEQRIIETQKMIEGRAKRNWFVTLLQVIWPIRKNEYRKFVPTALIMFLILFNVACLRVLKEGLIVPALGPEVVQFIKLWCMLPSVLVFTIIYNHMTNYYNYRQIFYITTVTFAALFTLFAFVLYPNHQELHLSSERINELTNMYPHFRWFIILAGNWVFPVLYILAELWLSVMLQLLFWQFANQISTTKEAHRFYTTYIFIGHLGPVVAGTLITVLADENFALYHSLFNGINLSIALSYMVFTLVIACTLAIIIIFFYVHKFEFGDRYLSRKPIVGRKKVTFFESMGYLFKSPYLGMIAIMIISYATIDNLCESVWRSQVYKVYASQDNNDFLAYYANLHAALGMSTMVLALFGGNIIRYLSWYTAAMATPIIFSATGFLMFLLIILDHHGVGLPLLQYILPASVELIKIVVIIGFMQHVAGKGCKYALLDACKEMSYIPLEQELKTKGKAAVDLVCNHVGKLSGAFVQAVLFTIFPMSSYQDPKIIKILFAMFMVLVVLWFTSVKRLNRMYQDKLAQTPEEEELSRRDSKASA